MFEKRGISEELKHEIMKISQIMIKQSYFHFQITLSIQEEGLAMGTAASYIFSELYLQYIEHKIIPDILLKYHIVVYFRYLDDILVVHNKDTTNLYDVFDLLNNIMLTMKLSIEEEKENKINFLDIIMSKENDNFYFDIHRKPTTTDTIIPNDSCHPHENKVAAIRYPASRMETYNLNTVNK
jgi:hypothetical protein